MTCIALANLGNALVFVGDGVSTSDVETGAIGHNNVPKVFPLVHLHAVFGFAGLGMFGIHYQALVNTRGYDGFDDMADNMVDDAREAYKLAVRNTSKTIRKLGQDTCLVIGGWSKRDQALRVFHMTTYEKQRTGVDGESITLKPFLKSAMDYRCWGSTNASEETMAEFDLGADYSPDDNDINKWIRYLGRMICATRASCGTSTEHGKVIGVGGMVQFCCLDLASIQTWIAKRWPEDEPGYPIDPSEGERLPDIFRADYEPAA